MRTFVVGLAFWFFVGCVNTASPHQAVSGASGAGATAEGAGSSGLLKPPVAPPSGAGSSGGAGRGGVGAPKGSDTRAANQGGRPTPDLAADGGEDLADDPQPAAADTQPTAALPTTPGPRAPGQLVITELMIDPKTLSDSQGEWLELQNTGTESLELQGCMLDDGSKEPRLISASLLVQPLAYVTIARSEQPGFVPSYVTSVSFTNTADTIALRCGGVEIDRVSYDKTQGFPVVSGASASLDPSQQNAEANNAARAWCPGVTSYGPELGTPGRANPPCDVGIDAGVEH